MCRIVILLLAGLLTTPDAHAAESYDSCKGFIDSLPATISSQGTWCLRKDLSTAMASGSAITVATNNVTIDCNDFKIGGLAAGTGSEAFGITVPIDLAAPSITEKQNITIRNCNIRGFLWGVYLDGAGHLVEDNRLDGNLGAGAFVSGRGSRIQRNLVLDTGGSTSSLSDGDAFGLFTDDGVDVLDNTIDGVTGSGANGDAYGIQSNSGDLPATIANNRIRNLIPSGTGAAAGIRRGGGGVAMFTGNHLAGIGIGSGISCGQPGIDSAKDNVAINFTTGIEAWCVDDGGNVVRNAPL